MLTKIVGLTLLGLLSGVTSGLLGVGGGIIIVPLLVYAFKVPIKIAVGTSLAVIIPTAIAGGLTHYKNGNVDLAIAVWVALGAVAAGSLGALAAEALPDIAIKRVFAVLMVVVAIRMFISK